MKNVKPKKSLYTETQEIGGDRYFSVEDEDGVMRCSCGRELIKMDETTYRCSGGYPVYRFADGSVVIDKFGNLMFKSEEHSKDEKN